MTMIIALWFCLLSQRQAYHVVLDPSHPHFIDTNSATNISSWMGRIDHVVFISGKAHPSTFKTLWNQLSPTALSLSGSPHSCQFLNEPNLAKESLTHIIFGAGTSGDDVSIELFPSLM